MSDSKDNVTGLDDGNDSGMIKLVSKDAKDFIIEKKYAFISNLVKTSMENGNCCHISTMWFILSTLSLSFVSVFLLPSSSIYFVVSWLSFPALILFPCFLCELVLPL